MRIQRLFVTAVVGEQPPPPAADATGASGAARGSVVYRGQELDCLIQERSALRPGDQIETPAIVVQDDATTFLPPGAHAEVAPTGDLLVTDISPA